MHRLIYFNWSDDESGEATNLVALTVNGETNTRTLKEWPTANDQRKVSHRLNLIYDCLVNLCFLVCKGLSNLGLSIFRFMNTF